MLARKRNLLNGKRGKEALLFLSDRLIQLSESMGYKKGLRSPFKGETKETNLVIKKMAESKKGKKLSPEHIEKIRQATIRRFQKPEERKKMSLANFRRYGNNIYIEKKLRWNYDYRLWQKAIKQRDGYKCIWCGSKEKLEIDHIKSFIEYPELRLDINNGRTLCHYCHIKTESYGKRRNLYVRKERQDLSLSTTT